MTTNLAAIIEAAAEADYMAWRKRNGHETSVAWPNWGALFEDERIARRERIAVIVTTTLDAYRAEVLMPLAESLEAQSKVCGARAGTRDVLTEAITRGADMGKAIAYMDAATQLRKAGAL